MKNSLSESAQCRCPARLALESIVPTIQKRADALQSLCGSLRDERWYRNVGAATGMHNLANEIGSFIVSPALDAPCACAARGANISQIAADVVEVGAENERLRAENDRLRDEIALLEKKI